MSTEREAKRMVDNPNEPYEVRALLRAGIDDEVTDYDYKRGLAAHMAAIGALPTAQDAGVSQAVGRQQGLGQAASATKLAATQTTALKSVLLWVGAPIAAGSMAAALWLGDGSEASSKLPSNATLAAHEMASPDDAARAAEKHVGADAVVAEAQAASEDQPANAAEPANAEDELAVAAAAQTNLEGEPAVTEGASDSDAQGSVVTADAAPSAVEPRKAQPQKVFIPPTRPVRLAQGKSDAPSSGQTADEAASVATSASDLESEAEMRDTLPSPAVALDPTPPDYEAAERAAAQARQAQEEAQRIADALLQHEMAQLMQAKRALREHPARALALARSGEREFRDSLFTEERQHVELLALIALGQLEEARRLAKPYIDRYPGSPFARRVQNALQKAAAPE